MFIQLLFKFVNLTVINHEINELVIFSNRVKSPNSGCLLNIGNGPQSGPPLYSKAEGRFAALHFIMG